MAQRKRGLRRAPNVHEAPLPYVAWPTLLSVHICHIGVMPTLFFLFIGYMDHYAIHSNSSVLVSRILTGRHLDSAVAEGVWDPFRSCLIERALARHSLNEIIEIDHPWLSYGPWRDRPRVCRIRTGED